MKNKVVTAAVAAVMCAGIFFSACENPGKSILLGEPAAPAEFSYEESRDEGFESLNKSAQKFAAEFAAAACNLDASGKNFAVSPVSMYSALALAAECSSGDTRTEILSAMNTDYAALSENYSDIYRSLFEESDTSLSSVGNSVWMDSSITADNDCINTLAEKYGCYSYSADFASDNGNANLAVKHFIKQQTRGLIDENLQLGKDTLFTLINTFYLKDTWNMFGEQLDMTKDEYKFTEYDGGTKNTKLMQGNYAGIKVFDGGNFTSCYAQTNMGYTLTFILPDDGVSLDKVFTAENISAAMSADYSGTEHENKIHYHTRCLFPAFSASYNGDVKDILRGMGINSLFEAYACDLSSLIPDFSGAYCPEVKHITKLKVDRRGIEGAAITAIPTAGSPGPDGYENVYLDFVADRAFGFIISDKYSTPLFAGAVASI